MNKKYKRYIYSAKNRGHEFDLKASQFEAIICKKCYYCGAYENIGIDRLDPDIGYITSNCVPACSICNFIKQSMSQPEFLNRIGRIYMNRFKLHIKSIKMDLESIILKCANLNTSSRRQRLYFSCTEFGPNGAEYRSSNFKFTITHKGGIYHTHNISLIPKFESRDDISNNCINDMVRDIHVAKTLIDALILNKDLICKTIHNTYNHISINKNVR